MIIESTNEEENCVINQGWCTCLYRSFRPFTWGDWIYPFPRLNGQESSERGLKTEVLWNCRSGPSFIVSETVVRIGPQGPHRLSYQTTKWSVLPVRPQKQRRLRVIKKRSGKIKIPPYSRAKPTEQRPIDMTPLRWQCLNMNKIYRKGRENVLYQSIMTHLWEFCIPL